MVGRLPPQAPPSRSNALVAHDRSARIAGSEAELLHFVLLHEFSARQGECVPSTGGLAGEAGSEGGREIVWGLLLNGGVCRRVVTSTMQHEVEGGRYVIGHRRGGRRLWTHDG